MGGGDVVVVDVCVLVVLEQVALKNASRGPFEAAAGRCM